MENNDSYYEALQKQIQKRSQRETDRKERHNGSRIIFNSEISPVQIYENVMDNTVFVYKNRVLEENWKKVIFSLKGIRKRKMIGSIIQWIGILSAIPCILVLLSGYTYRDVDIKYQKIFQLLPAAMFAGILMLFIGGLIRCSGRRFMGEYLRRPSPFSDIFTPIAEFNRLENGQLVLMVYARHDKKCGGYISALKTDDTKKYTRIPTYVDYMYIIDTIRSCTRTENGLMIQSAGRYYGTRGARHVGDADNGRWLHVFAETQVSYRKDEVLAIFSDMEQLEEVLMNYGYFEPGKDAFSPL